MRALDRIALTVARGSTFGLVGESGCGKSVTVRSMMRIIQSPGQIDGGRIVFFPTDEAQHQGIDLLRQSEAFMQRLRGEQISMIFQEPNAALNPIMSIGDQVAESFLFHRYREMSQRVLAQLEANGYLGGWLLKPLYRLGSLNPDHWALKALRRMPLLRRWETRLKKEARQRAVEMIGQLGIANPEEIVRRFPHNLSGGMKQRIVIAIALACHPMLLIADEATSNLDVTIQAQILDLLRRLKASTIASILLITHDLGVVAETCDRVGVMYAGQLCEVADVEQLFNAPQHPYTRALLSAVPRLHQEGPLTSIQGNVPNLVTPPQGCRFHPRCPQVMDRCR
ncbi:MAG: ABC transporter ATP-binding protein, partial [Desulfobacterales bacterium]